MSDTKALNNQRDTARSRVAELEQEVARLQSRIAYLEGWKENAEKQKEADHG